LIILLKTPTLYRIFGFLRFIKLTHNGLRAGARYPVLRLRQGYGACTLLWVGLI
jgi:hypothetical protein